MNLLWGLVNSLQITVRSPLIQVNFPENAQTFFSTLFMVTNFDIIPSDVMNGLIFAMGDSQPMNSRFGKLDIF